MWMQTLVTFFLQPLQPFPAFSQLTLRLGGLGRVDEKVQVPIRDLNGTESGNAGERPEG